MSDTTSSESFDQRAAAAGASGREDRETLEAQVARLREDLQGVADAMKNLASHQAEGAKRQAYALRDDMRDRGEHYMRQAQEAASDFEEQVSERVRAEPIKSVLIAAAIGYVYARLFR